ncbi:MAG: PepSY domain-containing protein [Ardenticatenia bacterium]|nr:PepSY domain-containing protein [Ardenticatenia bacterium]
MNRVALFLSAVLTSFVLVIAGALIGNMRASPADSAAEAPVSTQVVSQPADSAEVTSVGSHDQGASGAATAEAVPSQPPAPDMAEVVNSFNEATVDAVENIMQQRESQYQALLDQANRQLQQAYAKQEELARIAQEAQAAQAQAEQLAQQLAEQLAAVQAAQQAQAAAQAQAQAQQAQNQTASRPAAQPPAPTYAVSPDQAVQIALSAANGGTLTKQPELVLFEGTPAYEVGFDRGMIYVDANTGAILYNGTVPPPPPPQQTRYDDDDDEYEEREDDDDEYRERDDDDDHDDEREDDDD